MMKGDAKEFEEFMKKQSQSQQQQQQQATQEDDEWGMTNDE